MTAKIKKGKVNVLEELNVDPTKIAKAVIDKAPGKSSVMDMAKGVLELVNQEPIKTLIQVGLSSLIPKPEVKTYHSDSSQSEKAIAPRSASHELLFKMLNGYDEQVIAKVIPFMKFVPKLLETLESNPEALTKVMEMAGGFFG